MKFFDIKEYENDYSDFIEFRFEDKILGYLGTYLIGINEKETTTLDFKGDYWLDAASSEEEEERLEKAFEEVLEKELEKKGIKL